MQTPKVRQCSSVLGVTLVSPKYAALAPEACRRFSAATGCEVLALWTNREPAYLLKLELDRLVAPQPIVFFDVDLWFLRPFDFEPLATGAKFCAVLDLCVEHPQGFPRRDCAREGWNTTRYFNSGLFACDLRRPEIRGIFADARQALAGRVASAQPAPSDYGDQFWFNAALQGRPELFQALPAELNFFAAAVVAGSYPHYPAGIIGLHAAGVRAERKLEALQQQAAVFGPRESL
jgi:hypothetical protein